MRRLVAVSNQRQKAWQLLNSKNGISENRISEYNRFSCMSVTRRRTHHKQLIAIIISNRKFISVSSSFHFQSKDDWNIDRSLFEMAHNTSHNNKRFWAFCMDEAHFLKHRH